MNKIKFKYNLNDVPPLVELLLFSLQWLAITVPIILIIGNVVARLHFENPLFQVNYIQKLFFITAATLFVQLLWGHRLPLITGPAAVLLVGVVASQGNSLSSIYTSTLVGGIFLFAFSITGLFSHLIKFFTPRVIASILILIAFTLIPMIINLIINPSSQTAPLLNLTFAVISVFFMFIANKLLKGIWKATLIIWAVIIGTIIYYVLFGHTPVNAADGFSIYSYVFYNLNFKLTLEPGVLISFLVCFIALSVNDLVLPIGVLLIAWTCISFSSYVEFLSYYVKINTYSSLFVQLAIPAFFLLSNTNTSK